MIDSTIDGQPGRHRRNGGAGGADTDMGGREPTAGTGEPGRRRSWIAAAGDLTVNGSTSMATPPGTAAMAAAPATRPPGRPAAGGAPGASAVGRIGRRHRASAATPTSISNSTITANGAGAGRQRGLRPVRPAAERHRGTRRRDRRLGTVTVTHATIAGNAAGAMGAGGPPYPGAAAGPRAGRCDDLSQLHLQRQHRTRGDERRLQRHRRRRRQQPLAGRRGMPGRLRHRQPDAERPRRQRRAHPDDGDLGRRRGG